MNWIKESAAKGKDLKRQYRLRDIEIFIKDKLPEEIDPDFIFKYIASILPEHLLSGIDIIYVGQFDHLKKRELRAIYEDGAIFVTNEQESDMDMIDDIVHEVAHANEAIYREIIYGDGRLESEFKKKRAELYKILSVKGRSPPLALTHDITFNDTVDDYLFREIGYPVLSQIATFDNLFLGAYSVTSLREYFASGFEQYLMGEKQTVRDVCPVLFTKLNSINNLEDQ
jgi:uncharacterized protein YifN (PemK superfamily)